MLKKSIVKKHIDNTTWRTIAGHLLKSSTLIGQSERLTQKKWNQKLPCKIVNSKINKWLQDIISQGHENQVIIFGFYFDFCRYSCAKGGKEERRYKGS